MRPSLCLKMCTVTGSIIKKKISNTKCTSTDDDAADKWAINN